MLCDLARCVLLQSVSRLHASPYDATGAGRAMVPPTFLGGQHVDSLAIGIPDAPVRLNGGNSCRWEQDVVVGEQLERSTTVLDVVSKQGRSGHLVLYSLETVYRRPSDGTVAARVGHTTIRRYPAARPAHSPASQSPAAAPATTAEPPPSPPGRPVMTVTPTSRDLVRYAAATGDFYEAHYDQAFARARGFRDVIVHGLLKLAWLATAAIEYGGTDCVVRNIRATYRGVDVVGEPFTVWCDRRQEDELEVCGVSADGSISTVGTVGLARVD